MVGALDDDLRDRAPRESHKLAGSLRRLVEAEAFADTAG
jgi:hypothetical protein